MSLLPIGKIYSNFNILKTLMSVNKKHFNTFLSTTTAFSGEQLSELRKLQQDYPFSQVIHIISAKHHLDQQHPESRSTLANAAIYSSDRSILKAFIEGDIVLSDNPTKEVICQEPNPSFKKETIQVQETKPTENPVDEIDQLREEVLANLDTLIKTKDRVEKENQEKEGIILPETRNEGLEEKKQEKDGVDPANQAQAEESDTVLKETQAQETLPGMESGTKNLPGEIETQLEEEVAESISHPEEAKTDVAKNKKNPSNLSKEQQDLIDRFIKNQPKISPIEEKPVTTDAETIDLARESVSLRDDMASENLATIFARQGKITRAVEIYRKLIWKYPQKKAYFAAQIESLEKN